MPKLKNLTDLYHTLSGAKAKRASELASKLHDMPGGSAARVGQLLDREAYVRNVGQKASVLRKTVGKGAVGITGVGGAYEVGKHKTEGEQNLTLNSPYDV